MILVLYAFKDWLKFPPNFRMSWNSVKELSFGGNIGLEKATQIAYEEARASDSIWAHAAERLSVDKTPNGILDYFATYFAGKVQLYGKRPPSERLEAIDKSQAKCGTFSGGAKILELRDQASTAFTALAVSKKEFKAMIEPVKEGLKTNQQI